MDSEKTLLVADDDPLERLLVTRILAEAGYRVSEAQDGGEALEKIAAEKPALVLLDVRMPKHTGFEVVEQMRARGDGMPVLMLTSLDDVDFKVRGLKAGADDYVGKPCDPRELLARVEALLRRAPVGPAKRRLVFGDVVVDLDAKAGTHNGERLRLTRTEIAILEVLANARGTPVAREKLLESVWGYHNETQTRTVETHVWRLRKKIGDIGDEPKWILNITGLGYTLSEQVK